MEINQIADYVLQHYTETQKVLHYAPFGDGHINDTFLVKTETNQYILQRVNKNVFRTDALVHNYELFLSLIEQYQTKTKTKLTPEILKTTEGDYHVIDKNGYAWRLAEFIQGTRSWQISPETNISFKAARAMGMFQQFLNTLPTDEFEYTIINYHNPKNRLKAFKQAIEKAPKELLEKAKKEIDFSLMHQQIVKEYHAVEPLLPKRITHNDTKLDNMLFHGEQVLVIDLDTVMPSTVLFDYGDMVRSFTSPALEDEPDENKTKFRKEHFKALTKGYIEGVGETMKPIEKNNLLLGSRAIIFEQTLRFLTDYLQGNIYYKVKYPEHNLVRTKTQIKILAAIESNKEELQKYLDSL